MSVAFSILVRVLAFAVPVATMMWLLERLAPRLHKLPRWSLVIGGMIVMVGTIIGAVTLVVQLWHRPGSLVVLGERDGRLVVRESLAGKVRRDVFTVLDLSSGAIIGQHNGYRGCAGMLDGKLLLHTTDAHWLVSLDGAAADDLRGVLEKRFSAPVHRLIVDDKAVRAVMKDGSERPVFFQAWPHAPSGPFALRGSTRSSLWSAGAQIGNADYLQPKLVASTEGYAAVAHFLEIDAPRTFVVSLFDRKRELWRIPASAFATKDAELSSVFILAAGDVIAVAVGVPNEHVMSSDHHVVLRLHDGRVVWRQVI